MVTGKCGRYSNTEYQRDCDVIFLFPTWIQLTTSEFLRDLLQHYEIKLVHLNPNSILQIAVFVHLCEAFLGVPPNFALFKSYFLLKYQPNAEKKGYRRHRPPNAPS
jgi:hypothetical protein